MVENDGSLYAFTDNDHLPRIDKNGIWLYDAYAYDDRYLIGKCIFKGNISDSLIVY